jgi:hypothetical protein
MGALKHVIVPCLAVLVWTAPADAAVAVSFIHPEKYTDATLYGGYGASGQKPALDGIKNYLERLGERNLKPDQTLTVDVLDIDLAGRYEPWRLPGYNARYLRDITWPRITLRYTLAQHGHVVASAEETVTDLNYQLQTSAYHSRDPLRYEKAMLNDWFQARIVRREPPRD